MTQTLELLDELRQRLTALSTRYSEAGVRAAAAAADLTATSPPPEALLGELRQVSGDFTSLRREVLEQAELLAAPADPSSLGTLRALDSLLATIQRSETDRVQRAAWEKARETGLAVLDKVMALIHREDRDFPALAECQAKARELHVALSSSEPADLEHETAMVGGRVRPFLELVSLAEGWNRLDDDRCVFLQDAVTQSFGRQLGLAALRGKLGHEGEIVAEASRGIVVPAGYVPAAPVGYVPATPGAVVAAPVPETPPAPVPVAAGVAGPGGVPVAPGGPVPGGAPIAPGVSVAGGVPAAPGVPVAGGGPAPGAIPVAPGVPVAGGVAMAGGVPAAPGAPVASVPAAGVPATGAQAPGMAGGPTVVAPPGVVVTAPGPGGPQVVAGTGVAAPGAPLVVEIRLSGERVQVETPEERREREELLERLAADTAVWWVSARAGFQKLVERGVPPADAARSTLKRFPHLLSVPLVKSDEHDGGRLAEGYAILLQRLEKEEPGFVKEALTRLNPQFTTRSRDEKYPLGQELYLYVVAEGRLYKTYPDFLRDVLVHTLPEPGMWLQGTITDAEAATTIVTRGEAPGSRHEQSRTLTEGGERFGTHTFTITTGPLTARFFSVQATQLPEPTDIEIGLKENGSASDHAWIVVAPMTGTPEAPRKHRVGGTKIEELGKQCRAVWIAAYNSDPNAERRYELSIALKRKAPPPPKPQERAATSTFAKSSPFKPKR
jgi:hypothetical protein